MSILAILASSHSGPAAGNTRAILEATIGNRSAPIIDLAVEPLDYFQHGAPVDRDHFADIAQQMTQADRLLLATPVYWYAMSGHMKVLFDRLTDLITVRKDFGRALAGRRVSVIATGSDPQLPPGFEVPFEMTCRYFGMIYDGCFYGYCPNGAAPSAAVLTAAKAFGKRVLD